MTAAFIDLAPLTDAGLIADPARWREWREMRNATSHAYDEAKAQALALRAAGLPRMRRPC